MAVRLQSLPKDDGYRMPGEFEPHAGTWILWPERPDIWRDQAQPAQRVFAELASIIARYEPVTVGASAAQFARAREMMAPNVRVVELSSNDAWIRDSGPTFVINDDDDVRLVNWGFNAWGGETDGLYQSWELDEVVPIKVAEIERVDWYEGPLVLEGGSFIVDGEGTLITTEECLLHPSRNPDHSREDIEAILGDYLGVEKVIWLSIGDLADDETNGHVDGLLAYVRPGVLLLHWIDDPDDVLRAANEDLLHQLQEATDARGRTFEIHKLRTDCYMMTTKGEALGVVAADGTKPREAGVILPEIYANLYVGNGFVVVPQFDSPNDEQALTTVRAAFPERDVIGLPNSREILLGGGNIHCVTQQQPLGTGAGQPVIRVEFDG